MFTLNSLEMLLNGFNECCEDGLNEISQRSYVRKKKKKKKKEDTTSQKSGNLLLTVVCHKQIFGKFAGDSRL